MMFKMVIDPMGSNREACNPIGMRGPRVFERISIEVSAGMFCNGTNANERAKSGEISSGPNQVKFWMSCDPKKGQ